MQYHVTSFTCAPTNKRGRGNQRLAVRDDVHEPHVAPLCVDRWIFGRFIVSKANNRKGARKLAPSQNLVNDSQASQPHNAEDRFGPKQVQYGSVKEANGLPTSAGA